MSILKAPFSGPQTYSIDPLFDLKLAKYNIENLIKSASQLSLLFPAAITNVDSVISEINVEEDFFNYLKKNIGSYGKLISSNSIDQNQSVRFWGWDESSFLFAKRHKLKYSYPIKSTVAKVNSREFCNNFNQISKTGVPQSTYCNSFSDLNSVIEANNSKNIVIKPDFGNAGYGFMRSDEGIILEEDKIMIQQLFKKGHGVIVEPWLRRISDISSGFILSEQGDILTKWHHQTLCNHAGTYFANYIIKDDPVIQRYYKILESTILKMAEVLYNEGYFGPVGFDSFEYEKESGVVDFACAIEINARLNVGMIARSILDKVSDNKPSFFRFVSKKRHKLPGNYKEFENLLGDLNYNKETHKGVILITPLRVDYGNGPVRTTRSAFTVTADSVEELWNMDEELRKRLR